MTYCKSPVIFQSPKNGRKPEDAFYIAPSGFYHLVIFDKIRPAVSDTFATKSRKKTNVIIIILVGNTITTYLVDYRGYGYMGINADLVNVNNEPGSEASKNLRKGFMTLFSVYRDTVINSYYGDQASVIQYPISNTSWAAPMPADEGYHAAYSTDVDGNPIYTEGMTEEERYAAAKEAAISWIPVSPDGGTQS